MNKLSIERLSDFERDPSNNFLTRSEMMDVVKELIAIREALKGEQVPVAWIVRPRMGSDGSYVETDPRSLGVLRKAGVELTALFTAPQKPVISKVKLCEWLEDNFDIDDSQRDAFANCFAHHCNCIVKKED